MLISGNVRRAAHETPHITLFGMVLLEPVRVEIISPIPEGWGICSPCEVLMARADLDTPPYLRGLDEYPPDWQEFYSQLARLVMHLSAAYGESILIRLVDPHSIQGLVTSLRYGVRRYPTFVINGVKSVSGLDLAQVKLALRSAGAVEQAPA